MCQSIFQYASIWVFLYELCFHSCHSIGIEYTLKEGKPNTEVFQNNGISEYNVKKLGLRPPIFQKNAWAKHKMSTVFWTHTSSQ